MKLQEKPASHANAVSQNPEGEALKETVARSPKENKEKVEGLSAGEGGSGSAAPGHDQDHLDSSTPMASTAALPPPTPPPPKSLPKAHPPLLPVAHSTASSGTEKIQPQKSSGSPPRATAAKAKAKKKKSPALMQARTKPPTAQEVQDWFAANAPVSLRDQRWESALMVPQLYSPRWELLLLVRSRALGLRPHKFRRIMHLSKLQRERQGE